MDSLKLSDSEQVAEEIPTPEMKKMHSNQENYKKMLSEMELINKLVD